MNTCTHDLAERESACADGMCPICIAAAKDKLEADLRKWWTEGERREQQKRMASEAALQECVAAMKRVINGKLLDNGARRFREALEQAERVLAARSARSR